MAVKQTTTRTQTFVVDTFHVPIAFFGKGSVRTPKRTRPTFYSNHDAAIVGRVKITCLADGRGFSIMMLDSKQGAKRRTHYFSGDARMGVTGFPEVKTIQDYWNLVSSL